MPDFESCEGQSRIPMAGGASSPDDAALDSAVVGRMAADDGAAPARAANESGGVSSETPRSAGVPLLRPESHDARPAPVIREVQVPARLSVIQRAAPLLAFAALALFVVSVFRLRDTLQERNAARVALKEATAAVSALSAQLARSDSLVAAMSGANVRVVELASTQNRSSGARMFWDRATNRWTLVTHGLAPLPAGRTYQLWLVPVNSEQISAGTFNTDANGRAVVQATHALAEAELSAIAITEEPTGGSPQPTGTILVAGNAAR